jgi:dipeptidyl aminopeptidase/acylaminoacyl peptidase
MEALPIRRRHRSGLHPATRTEIRMLRHAAWILSPLAVAVAGAQTAPGRPVPASGPPAATRAVRPFTFEDVMAVRQVSDPQLSPDGRWVAYVVSAADMAENAVDGDIWLVPAAGGRAVRLTTSKKNDTQPRWSPDSRQIAFVSARAEKPQLFVISPFGGEAEQVTESKGGVTSFQWAPDGRRIAYVARRDLTADEERREKEKDDAIVVDQNYKLSRLWVVDVEARAARELAAGDYQASDPQWSPDGTRLAFVANPTPKADDGSISDLWVVDASPALTAPRDSALGDSALGDSALGDSAPGDSAPGDSAPAGSVAAAPRARKLVENEGPDQSPRWSPDGRQIAFLTRQGEAGRLGLLRLAVVPAAGGAPRLVAPAFDYAATSPVWSGDGTTLYFTAPVRTGAQLFAADVARGRVRQLSRVTGVMGTASISRDGRLAAFTMGDVQHPNDVHVAVLRGAWRPVKLTDHNPQVRALALGRSEVVRWKSRDGLEVEGLVVYPVDYAPGRRYPTVAFIHGGPAGVWTSGFPASWGNFAHVWASKGWVSFFPNPRGSVAYGEKFLLANVRDWGKGDYEDIQSGLDTLVARGVADSARLAQSGWSYDGYMTAWTITQTRRFKAAMVGAGLTNMYSMYSTNDIPSALDGYFGAEPWDDEEAYRRASAMTFIKQARTPTLIQHGLADLRVPVGQAQELYAGLTRNDVPAELVLYPREPHGLQEPRHQLDKMRREYAWFARYVLGEGAPATVVP